MGQYFYYIKMLLSKSKKKKKISSCKELMQIVKAEDHYI